MEKKIVKEFPYKNTRMGGLIKYLVFLDGKLVQPSRIKRSRSGNHGDDYYLLSEDQWRRAWILVLERSNSGKRKIEFIGNIPNEAKKQLEEIWIYTDSWIDDIAQLAKALQLSSQLKK